MRVSSSKRVGENRLDSFRPVFLKLGSDEPQGSPEGCRGFRGTKVPNGGDVLLAALNLHVRTTLHVTTYATNPSVTDITQTVNRCFNLEAS
jgi:hypothetical protein